MDPSSTLPSSVRVLVVGAGFGGLAMAIKLDEAGETDFLVIERGDDVGGTWRDNSYPGAACDVPSQLYSYSFAPNPKWSRSFSPQPEIQAYIQEVAERSGTLDHFRFRTELLAAAWDEQAQHWQVQTSAGDLTAGSIVSAAGALSDPKNPDVEGFESFTGEVFHSARWNHDYDLAGKRVAVIGTGASAIQIVPQVAPQAAHLDVYQRTAPWVIPRRDRPYTRVERFAFRHLPVVGKAYRTGVYWGRESMVPAFVWSSRLAAPARRAARLNIARGIEDPVLRAKVTPHFELGCKRVLISNDYYPALARDDVDLVTEPIAAITPTGIRTRDGTHHDVDVLVVATGFHTTDMPLAQRVVGRDGLRLADHFAEVGMQAYKGATVHGYPNLFLIVGPNTGLGHSSMVFMIEAQVAYAVDAIRTMRARRVVTVEPVAAAQARWNDDLQRRMRRTVWSTGGCSSWYLDAHGRNVMLWPRTTYTFKRLTARFDTESYTATPEQPVRPAGTGATVPAPTDDREVPA
jgi:cation diffusion facilitator CzcD-associated flavoprotein CzcO